MNRNNVQCFPVIYQPCVPNLLLRVSLYLLYSICLYLLYYSCIYLLYSICLYLLYYMCLYLLYSLCLYLLYYICLYLLYSLCLYWKHFGYISTSFCLSDVKWIAAVIHSHNVPITSIICLSLDHSIHFVCPPQCNLLVSQALLSFKVYQCFFPIRTKPTCFVSLFWLIFYVCFYTLINLTWANLFLHPSMFMFMGRLLPVYL